MKLRSKLSYKPLNLYRRSKKKHIMQIKEGRIGSYLQQIGSICSADCRET